MNCRRFDRGEPQCEWQCGQCYADHPPYRKPNPWGDLKALLAEGGVVTLSRTGNALSDHVISVTPSGHYGQGHTRTALGESFEQALAGILKL